MEPAEYEVKEAVKLIHELLCDFPFATDSDKAHAIALLLLPFCRDLIDGPTPLHLIEASMPRTGKSLLSTVLLYVGLRKNVSTITAPKDGDEWEKKITTALLEDSGAIVIDNVNHRLDSDKLAAALTMEIWRGRILGRSASSNVPIKCGWVTTANNISVSEEIAGRTVRIRLEPATDSPERRTGFTHPDIKEWVERERERLIQACHILIQCWVIKGRPTPKIAPLGSFEAWSRTIGGILESAEIPGFLDNFEEFYAGSNKEKVVWREFCRSWFDKWGEAEVLTSDLLEIAERVENFYLRGESTQARKISLGRQLEKKAGAIYSNYKIIRTGLSGGYVYWRLQPIEARS
jgi:hypothetical protein